MAGIESIAGSAGAPWGVRAAAFAPGAKTAAGADPDTREAERTVERLKAAERKVVAHELAHKAAGGRYAGPASYSYTRGPDGRNYISGGEVPIDVSPGKTPDETVRKMEQVIGAAMAPAEPSGQDYAVAARAAAIQLRARREQSSPEAGGAGAPPPSVDLYA